MQRRIAVVALAVFIVLAGFFLPDFFRSSPKIHIDPRLALFHQECVDKVLKENTILPSCVSRAAIQERYKLDPLDVLDADQGRMIMAARLAARGEIMDEKDLQACIDEGRCLNFPHPEKGVDENSPEGLKIRRLFWHLVNNGSLTPELCQYMDVCRALVKTGIVKPKEPEEDE